MGAGDITLNRELRGAGPAGVQRHKLKGRKNGGRKGDLHACMHAGLMY